MKPTHLASAIFAFFLSACSMNLTRKSEKIAIKPIVIAMMGVSKGDDSMRLFINGKLEGVYQNTIEIEKTIAEIKTETIIFAVDGFTLYEKWTDWLSKFSSTLSLKTKIQYIWIDYGAGPHPEAITNFTLFRLNKNREAFFVNGACLGSLDRVANLIVATAGTPVLECPAGVSDQERKDLEQMLRQRGINLIYSYSSVGALLKSNQEETKRFLEEIYRGVDPFAPN